VFGFPIHFSFVAAAAVLSLGTGDVNPAGSVIKWHSVDVQNAWPQGQARRDQARQYREENRQRSEERREERRQFREESRQQLEERRREREERWQEREERIAAQRPGEGELRTEPCGTRDRRRFPQDCGQPHSANDRSRTIITPVVAGPPIEGLVVPMQTPAARVTLSADPDSALYAVQAGYAWATGWGVPQNLPQGHLWFMEAQRRDVDRQQATAIDEMLREYAISDPYLLLRKGQRTLNSRDNNRVSLFYFGRAAELGEIQGMAILGHLFEGRGEFSYQYYWCRKAYRSARDTGFRPAEIDAVNHFCAHETFRDIVLPSEIEMNRISTERGNAQEAQIRHDVAAMNAFARSFISSAQSSPEQRRSMSDEGFIDHQIERNIRRDCVASGSTMC
jgi:hypothetical protein